MSTAIGARKRGRRRKPKLSVGSTSSCSSNFTSNVQAKLPELFARLTLRQSANEDERHYRAARYRPPVSKPCSEGEVPKTPRGDAHKTRSSLDSTSSKECEASASEVVENGSDFIREAEEIVNEKPGPKNLAESYVVDVVRQMREVLQEWGPSQEKDLLEALGYARAKPVLEAYGTLIAFLGRYPEFRVLHEDLYTFVYYQDPDDEDEEGGFSSLNKDGATTASCLASSVKDDGGSQYTEAGVRKHRRSRSSSSSSSCYESALDGEEDDREQRRCYPTKVVWSQGPSNPRYQSRAQQEVQQRCDAVAQTQGWGGRDRIVELELTLRRRDAKIAELRERLKILRECHARQVRQLHTKIEKLLRRPPPAPPRSVARPKSNRAAVNERKPTTSDGTCAAQNLPQPRRVFRQTSPPPRPKPEKLSARPVVSSPRPVPSVDKKFTTSAAEKWTPVLELYELPRSKSKATVPCSNVESSLGVSSRQAKTEQLISRTVQMVKKKQPNYTDQEIRRRVDHLRRVQGGFSGMTFNAIVALMLGHLKTTPQAKR
ncbi:hypothetical protein HPB52_011786 [Rhipicephalus sanguineus]|uniref:Uncharacterized protein n=1 Tax=Rhipicephalus sanguineus TaxID=34632 RepID=A0A9D4PJC5_RHISA|nr:hypothetical protein HPB52_011786 [Rhipicephalus sanguineus]